MVKKVFCFLIAFLVNNDFNLKIFWNGTWKYCIFCDKLHAVILAEFSKLSLVMTKNSVAIVKLLGVCFKWEHTEMKQQVLVECPKMIKGKEIVLEGF